MAVDLENDAKRVLDIDHPVGFFVWKILPHGHALCAASGQDFREQTFEIRVLYGKVKHAVLAKRKVIVGRAVAIKLEEFKTNSVGGRQMGNAQLRSASPENIRAHLPDVTVVFGNLGGFHDRIKTKDVGVELHSGVKVGNGQSDMRESARRSHTALSVSCCSNMP